MDEIELPEVIFRAVIAGDCRALVLEHILNKHDVVKLVSVPSMPGLISDTRRTAYARVTWVQVIAARWYVVSVVPTIPTQRMGT